MLTAVRVCVVAAFVAAGCGSPAEEAGNDAAPASDAGVPDGAAPPDAAPPDAQPPDAAPCGTPADCTAAWEDLAADRFDEIVDDDDDDALPAFLTAVPKGGDLHQHLSGSVWAETYLDWGAEAGQCINSTTHVAVSQNQCSTTNLAVPGPGTFYDAIVRAWSMEGFVAGGAQSGHDHFFATFGKFGAIAGARRDDSLADVAARAASENQLYIETMFNLGKNLGTLAAQTWSGAVTAGDLQTFYDSLIASPSFAGELAQDVAVVEAAAATWRAELGCDGASPPPACSVTIRFIAQVSRTGANDNIFGQLVSAFEMARVTGAIVGANLSSPEDIPSAINNYNLHMAMLGFLHDKYTATGDSPLQITLHAGELVPAYLPPGSTANTFHIRAAVEIAHASRIGHGVDILSETGAAELLATMASRDVLVEVCLSSNAQILEVSGEAHPLAAYLEAGVPVALATDDQGVSRSSLAGEYLRAVQDQELDYRQLKRMARNSLEHAFLPGDSLWSSLPATAPVTDCAPTATMGLGGTPSPACQTFLDTSERARMQWELERRFTVFERAQ